MEDEITDVARALSRYDIGLHIEGDRAQLTIDGRTLERRWITGERYGLESSAHREPTFVIGRRLAPKVIANVRARGDWFADERGNVSVKAPGVRVDIRGQRQPEIRESRVPNIATNLVSTRRAQVIFCLLTWPELVQAPLRRIAEAAGVSPRIAYQTRVALEQEGYLYPGATSIDRYDELLDRWAVAFPLGLGRDLTLGLFTGEPQPDAWIDAGIRVYISGESAAPALRATTLTMYVPEIDPRAVAASRWRRPADGDEPTITIRRTFWSDPQGRSPHLLAPRLLVYADLLASRDARQREIALAMRETLRDAGQR